MSLEYFRSRYNTLLLLTMVASTILITGTAVIATAIYANLNMAAWSPVWVIVSSLVLIDMITIVLGFFAHYRANI